MNATEPPPNPTRPLVLSLVSGGVLLIVVAVFLGATVDPLLYAIAAFSLVDFALAWAYASGRIGPGAERRRLAREPGAAAGLEQDASYSPYARED